MGVAQDPGDNLLMSWDKIQYFAIKSVCDPDHRNEVTQQFMCWQACHYLPVSAGMIDLLSNRALHSSSPNRGHNYSCLIFIPRISQKIHVTVVMMAMVSGNQKAIIAKSE